MDIQRALRFDFARAAHYIEFIIHTFNYRSEDATPSFPVKCRPFTCNHNTEQNVFQLFVAHARYRALGKPSAAHPQGIIFPRTDWIRFMRRLFFWNLAWLQLISHFCLCVGSLADLAHALRGVLCPAQMELCLTNPQTDI